MPFSELDLLLWNDRLNGDCTDCTFVFKIEGKTSEPATEKVLHAHKCILSKVSPVFKANFKSEWSENKLILVTSVKFSFFEKLLEAIYLGETKFENVGEAVELFEVADFYQVDIVKFWLRQKIQELYSAENEMKISKLIETANKLQDFELIEFSRKYFVVNTHEILENPDFLNFAPETINSFYQIDDLNATEDELLAALEKYVMEKGEGSVNAVKPAIRALRFFSLNTGIEETILLTTDEKNFFLGKNTYQNHSLSKNVYGRKHKQGRKSRVCQYCSNYY